jgi:hypothetical protein
MNELIIEFDQAGAANFVLDDSTRALTELGKATIERASHVVPSGFFKRLTFRVLRRLFGDCGRLANWTRSWQNSWQAEMVGGPVLRGYATRQAALQAERDWIRENRGL